MVYHPPGIVVEIVGTAREEHPAVSGVVLEEDVVAPYFFYYYFNSYATVVCCQSFFVPYAENPPQRI
jgi:hypothetical protein